jgi:ankyrin repeat protein
MLNHTHHYPNASVENLHQKLFNRSSDPTLLKEDVESYLQDGGDVNAAYNGYTFLMIASSCGYPDIVDVLLKHNANPHLISQTEGTALQYAYSIKNEKNRARIVAALKKAGAREYVGQPIEIMNKLGYLNKGGICYGLASVSMDYLMRGVEGIKVLDAMLYALCDDADEVVKKIHAMQLIRKQYIQQNKARITEEINRMTEEKSEDKNCESFNLRKLNNNKLIQKKLDDEIRDKLKQLFAEDAVLLDAPNFLQAVKISHDTGKYKKYFADNIPLYLLTQNVFVTFPLLNSEKTEAQGFATPIEGRISGKFSKQRLTDFFATWKQLLDQENLENPVTFMFESSNHAVSLAYLAQEKKWAFNSFCRGKTIVTDKEDFLADKVFTAFSCQKNISLACRVYSSKKDENKVNNSFARVYSENPALGRDSKTKRILKGSALMLLGASFFVVGIVYATPAVLFVVCVTIISLLACALIRIGCGMIFNSNEKQNEVIRANVERDAKNNTAKKASNNLENIAENKQNNSSSAEIQQPNNPTPLVAQPPKKASGQVSRVGMYGTYQCQEKTNISIEMPRSKFHKSTRG